MGKTRMALAALGFVVGAAQAHDGGYFDTFGIDGREQIGFAPGLGISVGFVNFVDLAVQPDGKIVVSATVANELSDDIGVLRLNPNGTLDTNFGIQGQAIVAFDGGGSNDDVASSVLLQPNGRIVVCGAASGDGATDGTDFGIVRLTASGAPDTQFNADGRATVAFDIGPDGSRNDVAVRCSLQADGKILAAGQAQTAASGARMAVARLNPDGSRDTGFNGSGTATIDFGPSYTAGIAFSVKSMSNGDTLLIGGASGTPPQLGWAFARLDANGQLDATFGNGGGQIIPFDLGDTNGDLGVKVLQDAQGRFLAVGFSTTTAGVTTTMLRLGADGDFDPSFGVGGKLIVSSAPPPNLDEGDTGTSAALTQDGGILVGSIANNGDSPSGLYVGLAKLVGDTIFDGSFELD